MHYMQNNTGQWINQQVKDTVHVLIIKQTFNAWQKSYKKIATDEETTENKERHE